MSFEQIVILFALAFLIFALYREIFHPSAVLFITVSFLVITGILSPSEALSGFSNQQIATIVLLLVLSNVIRKSGVADYLFSKVVEKEYSYKKFLSKMFFTVSSMSAFLNNTPIVAILLPYIYDWAKRNNISPSKLLIPLSYSAILGGTVTLIGTSTNLLVNGLAVDSGMEPFGIFDFAYVGIPAVLFGFLYIFLKGHKLLPDRKDIMDSFIERKKEYIVETVVKEGSNLIGRSVRDANLRNLKGLFLVEIIRKNRKIFPVSPKETIEKGDILIFAGDTEAITDLISANLGISLPDFCIFEDKRTDLVEIVVSYNSPLIDKKVKDTDFRAKYDAAIVAVHRNGERLSGKIGEIVLKPGDLLLIIAGNDFWKRIEDNTDFYIISKIKEIINVDSKKALLIPVSFFSVIILSVLDVLSLFSGLLILISLYIIMKISTYSEIKKGIDLNLVIVAALSLAVGKAMLKTGTAEIVADVINTIFSPFGVLGALIGIYIMTNILTEFVTNVAAASISFPVALASAQSLSTDPTAFVLVVAYGASASFITPIGYQTNLMVYAAGNYRFVDFLKVGLPLSIIYGIICVLVIWAVWL